MAQRKEAQEDLNETVKEHIYDMQISGLDDMMDGLQEDLEEWKRQLHSDLNFQTKEIKDILSGRGSADVNSIAGLLSSISEKTITIEDVSSILHEASKTMSNENTVNVNNDFSGTNVDGTNTTVKGASNNVDTGSGGYALTDDVRETNVQELADAVTKGTKTVVENATATDINGKALSGTTTSSKTTTSSNTAKSNTAVKKQTVTKAQANAAYKYMLSKIQFASKQDDKWGVFNKKLYNHDKNRQVMIHSKYAKEAWKKLGSPGTYSSQALFDVAKKTGIWDALIQIRTNKSKGIITTLPKSTNIHGYAKGGTVYKSGHYLTDEKGEEIIVTKQGILRPLSAGTSIIPADITERLYAIASNYDMNNKVSGIDISKLQRIGGETISPIINCPITIEGNANEQDVINAINKTLPKISKHVQNDIRKDLRKSGR